VRVRGSSGQWLTVHATVLGDGNALVTIEEGRPIALAPALLAAYDLTPLEGEVLRDVLHSADEAQIEERLGIAAPVVQATIASALEKVGVATRAELPKKLFFERYFELVERDEPLGPDGFFAVT
jgi:DNA-binding CsgD family transcriptional regulator